MEPHSGGDLVRPKGGGPPGDADVPITSETVSGTHDSWEWGGTPFFVWGVCKKIRDGWSKENLETICACRVLWKRKVPILVWILVGCF